MNSATVVLLAIALLVAGTIQFAADGALGAAAASASLPRAIANLVGERTANALALLPPGSPLDALAVSARVERLDADGDYRAARALQRSLVERLAAQRSNREVLADALWRLGQLDAEVGYREPSRRRDEWQGALNDYRRALELVPLSERILLAAGNQALLDGRHADATQYFERVLGLDPASEAGRDGLHRAQTSEGVPPPFVAPAEWNPRT